MNAGSEQQRHRHRIKDGDERQSEQPDRSLKIHGGDTDRLGEISYRSDFRLSTPALRVNPGFFHLQAGEHLGLALALSRDVSTFAPLLVSDRHSSDWPTKPRRFIDGRIDLSDTPIKVGDCSTLDPEASFDVCGSVREGKIYGCHVVEVGAREEAEHADGVQPHQHANHQDQDEAQEGWRRGPMLRQPGCRNRFRPPALRP